MGDPSDNQYLTNNNQERMGDSRRAANIWNLTLNPNIRLLGMYLERQIFRSNTGRFFLFLIKIISKGGIFVCLKW